MRECVSEVEDVRLEWEKKQELPPACPAETRTIIVHFAEKH